MGLLIREMWAKRETPDGEEWRHVMVVSMYKVSMSRTFDKETISSEQMFAICYYPTTGEILELPINECVIKELYDEKTRNVQTFGAPEESGAKGRENDWEHLRADHRKTQDGNI
jgi:hypothetical protein